MKNKFLPLILILIGVVILGYILFTAVSYSNHKISAVPNSTNSQLDKIMSIIKKSPDYPNFIKLVKTDNFQPELTEYYSFTPKVYAEKMAEWEKSSSGDAGLKKPFDTIQLNSNSYFVRIISKTNPQYGITAILDMAKKEPQILVINVKVNAKVGI